MTTQFELQTTVDRARTLRRLIDDAQESSGVGDARKSPVGGNTAVVVAEPAEFPAEDPDGTVKQRSLRQLNGGDWEDTGQSQDVRRISNGRQIAWRVGSHGLCVQDSVFWAVNIGSLAAATHPLTGHSEGVAAVLKVLDNGNLEITDDRLDFVRRDSAGAIADGTLIQLAYVSGTLTIVWADCEPHVDLDDLELTVEIEITP
jgi:hypothetical protein